MAWEFHFSVAALDANYAPHQLGRKNGRVVMAQTVAARDQARSPEAGRRDRHFSIHNSMDE